jgi:Glycosyl hydrolase family 12/Cellulose binding domain
LRRLHALGTAAVLAAAGTGIAALAIAAPAQAASQVCEQFGSAKIAGGKYIVQNNNWGDNTRQCIKVTSTGFSIASASHNKPQNGAPGSYPSVYAGCHYGNCSTGSGLPLQASSGRFDTVRTSVRMSYPNNGVYDAAYDLWFDPAPRTTGQNLGAEVMVWLNHKGSIQPVGSRVGTVNLNGATWDVWFGNIGWNVVSYVRQSATSSLNFKVSTFYKDVVSRGYGQRSWYLTSVQAGFEPWVNGSGLAVDNFSYSIGGGSGGGASPSTPSTPSAPSGSPSPSPTGGGSGGPCRVTYSPKEWPGGFVADVTIANTSGSPIDGWTLSFKYPGDQHVTNAWNASVTQGGAGGASAAATNVSYNGSIPAGGSTSFGFLGTWSSNNASPTAFTLNGTACSTG